MNLLQYLQQKYDMPDPCAILAVEARAFGVPYPLRSGWLIRHGNTELRPRSIARLWAALEKSERPSAKDGLRVLREAGLTPATHPATGTTTTAEVETMS